MQKGVQKLVDFSIVFLLVLAVFGLVKVTGSTFVPVTLGNDLLVMNEPPLPATDPAKIKQLSRLIVTRHVVSPGHHLWQLAKMYGTRPDSIYGANQLDTTDVAIGDSFFVPNKVGLFHVVKQKGDRPETLDDIARTYADRSTPKRNPDDVKFDIVMANDLPAIYLVTNPLEVGERIFVPNARTSMYTFPFSNYRITSAFGWRRHPVLRIRKFHNGIDIKKAYGSRVDSVRDGVVIFAGWKDSGYGNAVIVKHKNEVTTLYGHLSQVTIQEGETVKAGQAIGLVGATGLVTGPHLHFEVRKNGRAFDPRRSLELLGTEGVHKKKSSLSLYDFMREVKK